MDPRVRGDDEGGQGEIAPLLKLRELKTVALQKTGSSRAARAPDREPGRDPVT